MNYLDSLRQTGRTTRMVNAAIKAAQAGRAVYIVAATDHERKYIECIIERLGFDRYRLGIKVEHPAPHNLEWKIMKLRGAHPNCEVFVDHHAIEVQFRQVLNELHRYDEVSPPALSHQHGNNVSTSSSLDDHSLS